MFIINQKSNKVLSLILFLTVIWASAAQQSVPSKHWEAYVNVVEAGFSAEKLATVEQKFNQSEGAALMVVANGKVVLANGNITRRFMVHSIRKSFMSALYGIYLEKGKIDLDASLEKLGIDDINPLTDVEKKATVRDLLSARSGVYLPSAYSPRGMEKNLPERGSHEPGSFWYYSNWDFNTLCTIFEQQSGKKFFEEFEKKIAKRIGMEDFRLSDTHYRYEKDRSMHPAYLLNMSARDLARFGLLYLNDGRWKNKEIIPSSWITESTNAVSTDLGRFSDRGGYGYLWWVTQDLKGQPMYYASGSGGHRLMVLPGEDLVIVHRTNTYEGKNVSDNVVLELVNDIVNARTGKFTANPKTVELKPAYNLPNPITVDESLLESYNGSYKHPFLGYFTVRNEGQKVYVDTNIGTFRVFAITSNHFFPEDLETPVEFLPAPDEETKFTIKPVMDKNRNLQKAIMYY